jgi:hypothetical protein
VKAEQVLVKDTRIFFNVAFVFAGRSRLAHRLDHTIHTVHHVFTSTVMGFEQKLARNLGILGGKMKKLSAS